MGTLCSLVRTATIYTVIVYTSRNVKSLARACPHRSKSTPDDSSVSELHALTGLFISRSNPMYPPFVEFPAIEHSVFVTPVKRRAIARAIHGYRSNLTRFARDFRQSLDEKSGNPAIGVPALIIDAPCFPRASLAPAVLLLFPQSFRLSQSRPISGFDGGAAGNVITRDFVEALRFSYGAASSRVPLIKGTESSVW